MFCHRYPPLLYAQVRPLNERLREVPGAKMLVDVVQVISAVGASQLRKVVLFVCGNTLVCETIKEARSVAFEGQERCKVQVTEAAGVRITFYSAHLTSTLCVTGVFCRQYLWMERCLQSRA